MLKGLLGFFAVGVFTLVLTGSLVADEVKGKITKVGEEGREITVKAKDGKEVSVKIRVAAPPSTVSRTELL